MSEPLLSIRDLVTVFGAGPGRVTAVDEVSFEIRRGEMFGVVGELGCGKSATCRSIVRLFGGAQARIVRGAILFEGRDLVALDDREIAAIRGSGIAMIFQDPMTSLNPTMRIGRQIEEAVRRHQRVGRRKAKAEAIRLLERVGVPSAGQRRGGLASRTLRRDAPAGHDRHGASRAAAAPDCRRADDGARCHYPGSNPEAHSGAQAGIRDERAARHP